MKEFSIEEKAQRYDEALKKAITAHKDEDRHLKAALERIFPELTESEDEKIRKWCISHFKGCINVVKDNDEYKEYLSNKVLAWLEKQGEQKPADKVEPKFHEDEWVVTDKNNVVRIKSINNNYYVLENTMRFTIDYADKCWHLWTIQDAKAGDVLETEGFVFIFKEIREDKGIGYFCANEKELHEDDDDTFHIANPNSLMGSINNDFTHYTPATKEQRDFLFQKMHEAGYMWNADEKKLEKIEQNPAWSEEDEKVLNGIIGNLCAHDSCELEGFDKWYDWLKSLRDRIQPKQEWSEEEKARIDRIIDVLDWAEDKGRISYSDWEEYVCYVKTLRPQPEQNWYKVDNEIQEQIINYFRCQSMEEPSRKEIHNKWISWLKSLRPQNKYAKI